MAPVTETPLYIDPEGQTLTRAVVNTLARSTRLDIKKRIAHWVTDMRNGAHETAAATNDDSDAVHQYRAILGASFNVHMTEEIPKPAKALRCSSNKRSSSSAFDFDDQDQEPCSKRQATVRNSSHGRLASENSRNPFLAGREEETVPEEYAAREEGEEEEGEMKGEEEDDDNACEEEEEEEYDPLESIIDECVYPKAKKRNPRVFLELSLELMGLPRPVATAKGREFFRRALTMDPLTPVDVDGTMTTLVDWENDPEWNYVYARLYQPWFWSQRNLCITKKLRKQRVADQKGTNLTGREER